MDGENRNTRVGSTSGGNLRRAFAWVFAIASYAALVDLCAETFAAGSSLRWYVLIVGVAFLGVSGLLWRSNGASAKAEYAFIVVAGLAAYAGWTLGFGDARTLHAFGQPASVVAAALIVVALVVSAGRLFSVRGVPAVVRIAVGALVLYAILPLAVALFRGGLDAALDGSALGAPGPFWSRGAYVGIEVLLPLAVFALSAASIATLIRRNLPAAASIARIALALLLFAQMGALETTTLDLPSLAGFERPQSANSVAATSALAPDATAAIASPAVGTPAVATPAVAASQPQAAANGANRGGIGGALGNAFLGASDVLANGSDSPRQRVTAFLAKVAIARRYVRHADFDVSALAATLPADPNALFAFVRDSIALDGYDGAMRGANGTLMSRAGDADDKALLLAALLEAKSVPVRFARSTLSSSEVAELVAAARATKAPQAASALPDALFTDLGVDQGRIRSAATARDASEAAYVNAGLAFANERAPALWNAVVHATPQTAGNASAGTAPSDPMHEFVQASIAGQWVDLDPSLARLQPNAHLGGGTVETAPALAPDRYHVVRVNFIVAYGSGSKRVESIVLERTIRSSDVGGAPIALGIGSPGVKSLDEVMGAQTFAPYVDVGESTMNGTAFALHDARGERLASARLVIESAGPGVATKSHTRVLWDAESVKEPALALIHNYDMLVVPGPYGESFGTATMLETVAQMQPLLIYGATPPAQRVLPPASDLEPAYPMALLDYIDRDERIADALEAETPAMRFAFDRPDVVMLSNGLERAGNDVRGTTALDIVDNGRRAEAADPQAACLANVKRGLLDTYVEQHVLAFFRTPIIGAPQAFAEASRSGADPVFVSAAAPVPAGVPTGSLMPLRETVAQGEVAIAMRAPVDLAGTSHYAWWAIDPQTGNTVGRMDDGSGDAIAEDSVLLLTIKRVGMAFTLLSIVINGPQSVEDGEIGVFLGGASVIGEAISALKSAYDLGGGSYGAGGSGNGGSGGSGNGGSGSADGGAPPADGGPGQNWGP